MPGSSQNPGRQSIIAGDFNVVPTPFDIYPTKSWDKDALVQPEGGAAFLRGSSRRVGPMRCAAANPDEPMYTFGRIGGAASSVMQAFASIICF